MPSCKWRLRLHPQDCGKGYGSVPCFFGRQTHHAGTYRQYPQHVYDKRSQEYHGGGGVAKGKKSLIFWRFLKRL